MLSKDAERVKRILGIKDPDDNLWFGSSSLVSRHPSKTYNMKYSSCLVMTTSYAIDPYWP